MQERRAIQDLPEAVRLPASGVFRDEFLGRSLRAETEQAEVSRQYAQQAVEGVTLRSEGPQEEGDQ